MLEVCKRLGEGTFAGTRGNDKVAPISVARLTTSGRLKSTLSGRLPRRAVGKEALVCEPDRKYRGPEGPARSAGLLASRPAGRVRSSLSRRRSRGLSVFFTLPGVGGNRRVRAGAKADLLVGAGHQA
jgi:hypothetical protein